MDDSETNNKRPTPEDEPEYFWDFRGYSFIRKSRSKIYEPIATRSNNRSHKQDSPSIAVPINVKKTGFDVALAVSGWLISLAKVVIIGIYTWFAGGQLIQMQAATTAAWKSAETADKTLKTSQRPWVSVQAATSIEKLNLDNAYVTLTLSLRITNTGTSTATDGLVEMFPEPNRVPILAANWKKPCQYADRTWRETREGGRFAWPVGFVLSPAESWDNYLTGPTQGEDLSPKEAAQGTWVVLGCIVYRDEFQNVHHTSFAFWPQYPKRGAYQDGDLVEFRKADAFSKAD